MKIIPQQTKISLKINGSYKSQEKAFGLSGDFTHWFVPIRYEVRYTSVLCGPSAAARAKCLESVIQACYGEERGCVLTAGLERDQESVPGALVAGAPPVPVKSSDNM